MKIAVIGAGNVGATAALLIAQKELGEVVLVDIVESIAEGKALDIAEAGPVEGYESKVTGKTHDFAVIEGSDIVVVTSGVARKPGMSRSDLLHVNANIITSVTENIVQYAPNSMILMVSNPLDTMCYVAKVISGFPRHRVFGQAGVLDSARFRTFIAMELNVSVEDVQAMVLGGHGDSMVPLPSYSTVSGIPVTHLIPPDRLAQLIQRTRDGGAEIVGLLKTGSAFYAPGAAVAQMVESIVKDKRRLLPTTCWLEGEFGLSGVYVGVPAVLGKNGVESIVEVPLTEEEKTALHKSAEAVKEDMKRWEESRQK
ncbi:MAG: malate dehydrogenase [Abditibacteriales bacterium]|nr:malate dehydrogenase [Abditibacteriales bacterium]MDW8365369.1 malate dehydrogenase [Abditibacteriales bacterium]